MKDGWIKLHRKSIESQVFKNPYLWQLWTWCLMKANHEECWMNVRTGRGETQVYLKPGQFIFGRHSAAKQLGWKPATTQKRLKLLVDGGNCITQNITHASIVTICNWDRYQESEKAKASGKVSPKYHPSITNKNNKVSKDTLEKEKNSSPNEPKVKSSGGKKQKSSPTKKRKTGEVNPDVKTFILEWGEIWTKKFEEPYTVNWGKEGKLVKEMLRVHSLQELRKLREEFFRCEDSFIQNSDYSIGVFKTQLNKLIVARRSDPVEQARKQMREMDKKKS